MSEVGADEHDARVYSRPIRRLMNEPLQVNILTQGDAATLREMLRVFGAAFENVDTYTAKQPNDSYLEQLLRSDSFVAIAASVDERVVGGIAGYVLPKFEQVRSELYIYDLAVDEAFRRRGVATAMIEKLQAHAVARGIYVIFVQADLGDDPAIALYTKFGQREDVLHFDILPFNGKAAPSP